MRRHGTTIAYATHTEIIVTTNRTAWVFLRFLEVENY